jgi:hypothetical protein
MSNRLWEISHMKPPCNLEILLITTLLAIYIHHLLGIRSNRLWSNGQFNLQWICFMLVYIKGRIDWFGSMLYPGQIDYDLCWLCFRLIQIQVELTNTFVQHNSVKSTLTRDIYLQYMSNWPNRYHIHWTSQFRTFNFYSLSIIIKHTHFYNILYFISYRLTLEHPLWLDL